MDKVLGNELLEFVTVYVDDILIASENWDEHCYRIEKLLKRLLESNMTLTLDKPIFITQKVKFIGYMLSCQGFEIDPDKNKIIHNFSSSKNLKQLQSFLGMCKYYRR